MLQGAVLWSLSLFILTFFFFLTLSLSLLSKSPYYSLFLFLFKISIQKVKIYLSNKIHIFVYLLEITKNIGVNRALLKSFSLWLNRIRPEKQKHFVGYLVMKKHNYRKKFSKSYINIYVIYKRIPKVGQYFTVDHLQYICTAVCY